MRYILRFFREHLLPHLPTIVLGAFLLSLAGTCQSILAGSFNFVLKALGMGSKTPDVEALQYLAAALSRVQALFPEGSALRKDLYFLPFLLVGLFLIQGLLLYSGTMLMVRSGIKATQALRERLFSRMLDQEPGFFQKYPVGELLTRCITDIGAVQGISSNQFAEAVREFTKAFALLGWVLWMDWKLTLAIFLVAPVAILPIKKLSQRIRRINHRNQEASSRLLQRLKEVFSNARVVQGFAREQYEVERFRHQNLELYRLGMKSARTAAMSHPIMELVAGVLLAGLIFFAARRIESGLLSGPAFATYILSVYAFYDPVRRLTKLNNDVQVAQASLERVYSMLDRKPEFGPPANPKPVPAEPQLLRLEEVHFSYDNKHQVLRGIDLEVKRGETVALVGGSGGGKTTLVNLVPRFFDPTGGRLTLDGIDLRDFDPRELRRRIGIVTQETLLFMDSIHDNIAYGKEASREAVIEAAKKAHAHDFIAALPKGYDTPLAETGSSVSGGQRQRIAIARALLQDPPILILDEATSALDTESERAVQAALEALMQDRTTLVIAHRLSTVQRATRICVLKHGRVAEQGTHESLLGLDGEYARLYRMQFVEG